MSNESHLQTNTNKTGTNLLCRLLYGEEPLRGTISKLNRVVPTGTLCGVRGGSRIPPTRSANNYKLSPAFITRIIVPII